MKSTKRVKLFSILGVLLFAFASCKSAIDVPGTYKRIGNYKLPFVLCLDIDSSATYMWWTDIIMRDNGYWKVSKDSVYYIDNLSSNRNMSFKKKGRKLLNDNGHDFKKVYFKKFCNFKSN